MHILTCGWHTCESSGKVIIYRKVIEIYQDNFISGLVHLIDGQSRGESMSLEEGKMVPVRGREAGSTTRRDTL